MKTKVITLICLLSLSFIAFSLYSQGFVWAQGYGSTGDDVVMSQLTDAQGNHYMAGYFSGPEINFGSATLANSNGSTFIPDLFIVKFDAEWNPVWAYSPEGDAGAYGDIYNPVDLDVDESGNIYLGGSFRISQISFGDFILNNTDDDFDPFLVKLNPAGQVVWALSFGGDYRDKARCLKLSPDGNYVYLAGWYYSQAIDINGSIFQNTDVSELTTDIFLVKFSSAGSIVWANVAGGDNMDRVQEMDIDSKGNAILVGTFKGHNIHFGNLELLNTNAYFDDGYIAKYNHSGEIVWTYSAGGMLDETLTTISVGPLDEVYIAGSFMSQIFYLGESQLSNTVSSGEPSNDVFIAKFNSELSLVWVKRAGGDGDDGVSDICVDEEFYLFLTGGFNGNTFSVDDKEVVNSSAANTSDIVLLKLNSVGNAEWIERAGGEGNDVGTGISNAQNGDLYLTGTFIMNTNLGGIFLTNQGSNDIFCSKYCRNANLITGTIYLDSDKNGTHGVTEKGLNEIIGIIQPGNRYFISDSSGYYSIYVESGNYSIQIFTPQFYTGYPINHSASFINYSETDEMNDFGLQSTIDTMATELNIFSLTDVRKGQQVNHYIISKNVGTLPYNDILSCFFIPKDELSTYEFFNYSIPTPLDYNNDSISWDSVTMNPMEQKSIIINLTVGIDFLKSTKTQEDYNICYNKCMREIGEQINADIICDRRCVALIIKKPHDPNDIRVYPSDSIPYPPQKVSAREPLEYRIRFQNTGNDTCFNAIVLDTISENLDLSTLVILGSSHKYNVSLSGRALKFRFTNILLPDSTTNEAASHGFIVYRITPSEDLVIGDKINNTAYIYFDYEAPVVTNTVCTVIGENLGVEENEEEDDNTIPNYTNNVIIAPNPFNSTARVIMPAGINGNVIFRLYDLTGLKVKEIVSPDAADIFLDRGQLQSGLYIYQVTSAENKEIGRGKLTIQ